MLPEFPQFKSIELTDKEDVEKIIGKYPPYSDFNFVSMWSWDIKGEMRISVLNDNLVVRFTDYQTGKPFYSFLGDNKVNETADALLELSKKEGLELKLKLVPEDSIKNIDISKFKVEEDRDNFDYIYDLDKISEYKGGVYSDKRSNINSILKKFPNIRVGNLDLKKLTTKEDILKLDQEWLKNKVGKDADYEVNENELLVMERFFQIEIQNIFAVVIFDDIKFVGYSIFEILPGKYSICHFSKSDIHYTSLPDYLLKEGAKMLKSRECKLLNFEQDLGVPGLRKSKTSFRPVSFLMKFVCTNK